MAWARSWDVPSESSPRTYRVSQSDDGAYGCSCPAWTFRRRGQPRRECKHIAKLKVELAAGGAPGAAPARATEAGAHDTTVPRDDRPRLSALIGRSAAAAAAPTLDGALDELLASFVKGGAP